LCRVLPQQVLGEGEEIPGLVNQLVGDVGRLGARAPGHAPSRSRLPAAPEAGGILAVNISNRYLDMRPVMACAARDAGRLALVFDYDIEDHDILCFSNTRVLIVEESARAVLPLLKSGVVATAPAGFRAWTDDYSNMLRILK